MNSSLTLAVLAAPLLSSNISQDSNIVETLDERGQFETLIAAAGAADIAKTLGGDGPFTILAPNDDAFAKLGDQAIQDLLKPENKDTLTRILTYHVIAGEVKAADALEAKSAETLAGPEVAFSLSGGRLRVNGDVNVIDNDIAATNGIIHVIDQVLIPEPEVPEGRLLIGFFSEKPGAQLARYLGVNPNETLLVTRVTEGSEAQKADLRPYDLIVMINGKKATEGSIGAVKEDVGFGGDVTLEVLRRGKKLTIHSKVGVEKH